MKTVGIVGFGQMGSAIGAGILRGQSQRGWGVFEKIHSNAENARSLGGQVFPSLEALCTHSDIIILAVKPQDLVTVGKNLQPFLENKLVISIAAGVTLGNLEKWLQTQRLVRWMPNLAASVGESLVGIAQTDGLSEQDAIDSLELAKAIGKGTVVPERLMNAVTGISGSGIAFVFSFINGLALGGVRQGLPYKQALDFAISTCAGAARLLQENAVHPEEMISRVCSPAGTTIEGIHVLENGGLKGLVMDAVTEASDKASELEG